MPIEMTYEKALDKVKALLRKSQCNTVSPEEAAIFAAKAQEIMDKFQIEKAAAEIEEGMTLANDEPIMNWNQEPVLTACQKDKQWSGYLVAIVADANGCKAYQYDRSGGGAYHLIGRATDVQTARYMIGMLASEVRRLNAAFAKGYSDKYRRDFKYGVVQAIAVKLRDQWDRTKREVRQEQAGMALIRVDQVLLKLEQRKASVEEWAKCNMGLKENKSTYQAGVSAKQHGFAVGQQHACLTRAKAGLGSGQSQLKS